MPGKDLKNLYTVDNERFNFLDVTITNICKTLTQNLKAVVLQRPGIHMEPLAYDSKDQH